MAPSKRANPNQNNLPTRVYAGKSAYEWHPKEGGAIRLCKLDAPISEVWSCYEKATNVGRTKNNIIQLIKTHKKDERFTELAKTTQTDYINCELYIIKTFGNMHPAAITAQHIREFLNIRKTTSRSRANRERVFLSNLLNFAVELGLIKSNPAKLVKPLKKTRAEQEKQKRYVNDKEYLAVYNISSDLIKAAMEIAYLCAARQRDVLNLRLSDIKPDGLFIAQGKTGKKQIKLWTPRLKAAVSLAKTRKSKINSMLLFYTRDGMSYTSSGFKSIWKRYVKKALQQQNPTLTESFTFHDLKRKGITDFEGTRQQKQEFSGHTDPKMMDTYDTTVQKVRTIKRPLEPTKAKNVRKKR